MNHFFKKIRKRSTTTEFKRMIIQPVADRLVMWCHHWGFKRYFLFLAELYNKLFFKITNMPVLLVNVLSFNFSANL